MTYLEELAAELARVGIRGRLRDRILAEAADHLAEGDAARFGEPREIARRFGDELATAQSRRAAFRAFAALAAAGLGFAAAWLLVTPAGGWPDIFEAELVPLGFAAALGMLLCPQVALVAGTLALLRARQLRHRPTVPAAEAALILSRARTALAFGAGALVSVAVFAVEFRADLATWYTLAVVTGTVTLSVPLVAAATSAHRAASIRSNVPGTAGDLFDDLPLRLPRRPWLVCLALAAVVGALALAAGGGDEGLRNALIEATLVVACFAALGRRLGLR